MLSLALGCSFGCDYKARVELSSDLGTVTRTSGSGTESTVSSAGSNVGMNKRMWVSQSLSPGLIALIVGLVLIASGLIGAYCYTQRASRMPRPPPRRTDNVVQNQAYAYNSNNAYEQPSTRQSGLYDEAKIQAALDADGYVIDTYFQEGQQQQYGRTRRNTITAQTSEGSLYAIPFEDDADLPASNSSGSNTTAKQQETPRSGRMLAASPCRVVRNTSYEEATAGGLQGKAANVGGSHSGNDDDNFDC